MIDHFPLDILTADFDNLPEVSGDDLIRLTRWALFQIPNTPDGTRASSRFPKTISRSG